MSSSTTPRSRSSGPSTACELASGSSTRSCTLSPARVIDLQMFFAEVTAPVMMWTSASRRTPDMLIGSLIPSWSSTMNSCGMTWMISRSMGMATAFAASMTRSTSACEISLSLRETAITPRELIDRMWSPAIPAWTPLTWTPAMRSASSTARAIEATVFSRSTTTPRRSPSDGLMPTPTILRSRVSGSNSAMIAEIFVVPISRPTYVRVCDIDSPPPGITGSCEAVRGLGGGRGGNGTDGDDFGAGHVDRRGGLAAPGEVTEHDAERREHAVAGRFGRQEHVDAVGGERDDGAAGGGDVDLGDG